MIAVRPLTRFSLLPVRRPHSTPASAPEFIGHDDFYSAVTDKREFHANEGRMPVDDVSVNRRLGREKLAPQTRPASGSETK
ncbi:MAG: hypothetical protein P8Z30_09485 [Acidobacteriota bacterium]